ncbi:hypothetical protein OHA77_38975 [Streptosporangium sp. NBC_01639]|uniref:hypothetical protein n=1 Tax=Streptosporangium sp. NBC_01639 TaxID=2975948 RepID=UPI00386E1448|nr:hypothetical protein OHA77_38975 [Streptosporangium sp. NBC_01639]
MNAPDDIEHLLRDLEREGLILHLGIGDATVWFATEFREQVIADRLAMLPDKPLVSVATAAAVLNAPHSHVIAEVRAATLTGHDSGHRIWVRREALVRRLTALGSPRSAPPRPARPNSLDGSTHGHARP